MGYLNRALRNVTSEQVHSARGSSRFSTGTAALGAGNQLEMMGEVPTLFAVVDKLASTTAAVDWKLYRKGSDEEVSIHPALSVWNRPTDGYTQRAFIEATMQHYDLTGEMWWIVTRVGVVPYSLIPVRPDRITPVPGRERFIEGYIYRNGAHEVPLQLEDVIYTRRQNPSNPLRGISPIASLMADIQGEKAAAQYNALFFRNGAKPGGIVEVDENLSDTEFDNLVRHWKEQHEGVQNAHRVAFLEKGVYKELTYSRKDMEFVELRRFSKDQILEAYGFPKFMLGIVTDVNRANAEASRAMFAESCTVPRLDLLKDALNTQFLPLFGGMAQGVEFRYSDPIPQDAEGARAERTNKVDAATKLIAAGFDPSATLEALGLPPIPLRQEIPA